MDRDIKPIIKPDPGARSRTFATIPSATSAAEAEGVQRAQRSVAPSILTRGQESSHRANRSGAPSAFTREPEAEDEDDDVVFMEMRARSSPGMAPPAQPEFEFQSIRDLGSHINKINDTLGKLQQLGISDRVDDELPELVLVGDQSSGKSSLMSALAGLALPRGSGTCTRCPIHIRISRAAEWSCRISLQYDYDYQPNQPRPSRNVPFPHWVRRPQGQRVTAEFKVIRDKLNTAGIESTLRWAQLAILNPSTDYHRYKGPAERGEELDQDPNIEAKFSPNVIALEVRGPGLAEFSFYDLPGIVATFGDHRDNFLENVLCNLAKDYMSHKRAIILWTVPMNNDPENSSAWRVIREVPGARERCVGVMTKADLLRDENKDCWLSMLKKHHFQTGFGYYITSRSRQAPDLEQQTAEEESFFNRQAGTWPAAFEEYGERCGVIHLKEFVSQKLAESFAQVLPHVKARINQKLQDVVKKLDGMPVEPPNPELEVNQSLNRFSGGVKIELCSQPFYAKWDLVAEEFSESIQKLKPRYKMVDAVTAPNGSPFRPPQLDTDGLEVTRATPTKRKLSQVPGTPSTRRRLGEGPSTPVKREHSGSPLVGGLGRVRDAGFLNPGPPPAPPPTRSLTDIRNFIRDQGMPGQRDLISAETYEPLCMEAIKPWIGPLHRFVIATIDLLRDRIMSIFSASFAQFKKRAIYDEFCTHLDKLMDLRRNALLCQLDEIYNLETKRIFTKNERLKEVFRQEEEKVLLRVRHHQRWLAHTGEDPRTPLTKIEDMSPDQLQKEATSFAKQNHTMGEDKFKTEIGVMAYVRSYYLTAAARFIDVVNLHIASGLFPNMIDTLDGYLEMKLKDKQEELPADELWDRLMREDEETADDRQLKLDEKSKFDEAIASIETLEAEVRQDRDSNSDITMMEDANVHMDPDPASPSLGQRSRCTPSVGSRSQSQAPRNHHAPPSQAYNAHFSGNFDHASNMDA